MLFDNNDAKLQNNLQKKGIAHFYKKDFGYLCIS